VRIATRRSSRTPTNDDAVDVATALAGIARLLAAFACRGIHSGSAENVRGEGERRGALRRRDARRRSDTRKRERECYSTQGLVRLLTGSVLGVRTEGPTSSRMIISTPLPGTAERVSARRGASRHVAFTSCGGGGSSFFRATASRRS
jgi:hypothetical protein